MLKGECTLNWEQLTDLAESDAMPSATIRQHGIALRTKHSAPDRNRTYDTFFRREVLYPLSY